MSFVWFHLIVFQTLIIPVLAFIAKQQAALIAIDVICALTNVLVKLRHAVTEGVLNESLRNIS